MVKWYFFCTPLTSTVSTNVHLCNFFHGIDITFLERYPFTLYPMRKCHETFIKFAKMERMFTRKKALNERAFWCWSVWFQIFQEFDKNISGSVRSDEMWIIYRLAETVVGRQRIINSFFKKNPIFSIINLWSYPRWIVHLIMYLTLSLSFLLCPILSFTKF